MNGSSQPFTDHPERVDPDRLLLLLEDLGWKIAGGRNGIYKRLTPPTNGDQDWGRRWSLLVPLDKAAPDFGDSMRAAILELSSSMFRDLWAVDLAPRLTTELTDSFRFRKESSAPTGLIPWRQGEDLISAARSALIAGAKSHIERLRRYSNRHGQFAGRYLDSVLMGQTAIGSYVVTAYAPANAPIALSGTSGHEQSLPEIDSIPARRITQSVVSALEATAEGLSHYHDTGSLSGFDAAVQHGFSYELSTALTHISKDSSGGDIEIEYDPASPPEGASPKFTFEFKGADTDIFERVARKLAVSEESSKPTTITGRVHLLTKKHAGGPGIFGLETLVAPTRKFRVRLDDADQYHLAVRAHDEDLAIQVFGDLERDGMMYWLYNAHIQGTVGSVEEIRNRTLGAASGAVQERLEF
ncbi:hypothetical protein V1227_33070 [Lentzea sp. DG1S-22]|uniref:hypothetical protein n=1 Tax=Lentzea sp. DG1S-22 TaxID=3108822 RepID=UPI002E774224|nr:hypothetical protein [Lentzea sp. DG1S-22]WVH79813.1 hypothetical protein V1227_33070 [Lentzea sp. DG1S-22]